MSECTIAVIEDEGAILQMLCDLLEDGGFSVVPLGHPEEAEKMDRAIGPALFLIDLMLPGRTGIELAGQLRQGGFTDTPMIAMSASRLMTRRASDSGLFQDTIYKPFDLAALLDCIQRHVVWPKPTAASSTP